MRQLVCMSADVYCQITNNFFLRNNIILYSNGKKGKGLVPGETERECVSLQGQIDRGLIYWPNYSRETQLPNQKGEGVMSF